MDFEPFLRYVRHLSFPEQRPLLRATISDLREEFFLLGADAPCHPRLYHLRARNRLFSVRVHDDLRRVDTYWSIVNGEAEVPPCDCVICSPTDRVFPPLEAYPDIPEVLRVQPPPVPAVQELPRHVPRPPSPRSPPYSPPPLQEAVQQDAIPQEFLPQAENQPAVQQEVNILEAGEIYVPLPIPRPRYLEEMEEDYHERIGGLLMNWLDGHVLDLIYEDP